MVDVFKCERAAVYHNTRRLTPDQIKTEIGCTHVLNAGFFNPASFEPLSWLVIDGKIISQDKYMDWGFGCYSNCAPKMTTDRTDNFISLVPILKDCNRLERDLTPDVSRPAVRSAVGWFPNGRVLLLCDEGIMTRTQLQTRLLSYGCVDGLMCDGGGSSQCDFPNGTVESERIVPTYLLFWEKTNRTKEETNIGNFNKKVCLDAGHDASNTANASPDGTYLEHEFALDMAKRIKSVLESAGVQVVETRPDSDAVFLEERCCISNKVSPDLFVSLHSNAAAGTGWNSARGWECYVYGLSGKRYEAAKAILARVEGVAPAIRKEAIQERPELYVLKHTIAPAILIEHGFHTNKDDVAWMKNDAYRQRLAQAEGYGILDYLCVPVPMEKTESELAVEWITGNGIMKGGESGDLMLEKPMTRKEFAVMMWRYKNKSEHGTF